jgi:lysophospholipase L1-like esterase
VSNTRTVIRGLILGAIVAACAAGCSAAGPSAAPSSLQKQTTSAAKVESRATVAAKATPTGTAGNAKESPARPARAKAKTAVRKATVITGQDITAVGDSVMLAVSVQLQRGFPGIYVNAVVSRHTDEGLSVLQALAASGRLRPVVIVGLGTNGGVTTQQVQQLMAIVGAKREVILVNTLVPLPYEQGTNDVLADAARTYPNVVLANWNKVISGHVSMLRPDGIHPLPSGAKVYVAMIKTAVAQAAQRGDASG